MSACTSLGVRPDARTAPGIRHRNVAAGVDILVGQRDEVAGPDAGFGRNEQAAGSGFKDRDADNVANAEADLLRGPALGKRCSETRQAVRQECRERSD